MKNLRKWTFTLSFGIGVIGCLLASCGGDNSGTRTVFKGPGDTVDCNALKSNISSALSAINSCTQNSDCALTKDLSSFGVCKRLGYNKSKSTSGLTSALNEFAASCESSSSCSSDTKTSQACVNGRCASNVDSYQ